jgi:hypothetical protein
MTSSWVAAVYNYVAFSGAFAALYVGHMTRFDVVNTLDPPFLQRVRFGTFIAIGVALLWSTVADWDRNAVVLGLVSCGVCSLLNNAMALYLRRPPRERLREPVKVPVRPKSSPPPIPRSMARQ